MLTQKKVSRNSKNTSVIWLSFLRAIIFTVKNEIFRFSLLLTLGKKRLYQQRYSYLECWKMSHSFEFDEDDAPWGDNIKGKPKSKKVKQRRRDTKRRYFDDNAEMEFAPAKWK